MPQDENKVAETVAKLKAAEKNEPIAKFLGMKLVEFSPGLCEGDDETETRSTRTLTVMYSAGL